MTFLPYYLYKAVKSDCFFGNMYLTRVGIICNDDFTGLKAAMAVAIVIPS